MCVLARVEVRAFVAGDVGYVRAFGGWPRCDVEKVALVSSCLLVADAILSVAKANPTLDLAGQCHVHLCRVGLELVVVGNGLLNESSHLYHFAGAIEVSWDLGSEHSKVKLVPVLCSDGLGELSQHV